MKVPKEIINRPNTHTASKKVRKMKSISYSLHGRFMQKDTASFSRKKARLRHIKLINIEDLFRLLRMLSIEAIKNEESVWYHSRVCYLPVK